MNATSHPIWSSLAADIAAWVPSQPPQPIAIGILALQGTGKSTLVQCLKKLLQEDWNLTAVCLSLDDLYLPYADRQKLKEEDPRLIWRGPPGTHDVNLGVRVLKQLRSQQFPVLLPQFDKSAYLGQGDRSESVAIHKADVILFEGWFVGVRPVAPLMLDHAPPPVVTDADREFALDMNRNLHAYLPLWEQLDHLILLNPTDYRLSIQWRQEAEAKMRATGKPGMSDAEIVEFVEYFWKALHPELFVLPLKDEPQWVDRVIDIAADHQPIQIYQPH
jgi:D-glycerate 3-kinase